MPERSGIELFAEDKFSAAFKKYDQGLKKAEAQAASTARSITKSGKAIASGWGTGIESTLAKMDNLDAEMETTRGRARDLLAEMDAAPRSAGGMATALVTVTAGLAALGAAAALGFAKLVKAIEPSLERHKELQEAQEKLTETWEAASDELAQTLGPAMANWTNLKIQALEALLLLLEKLKEFVAYVHIGTMAVVEFTKEFGKWYEILIDPVRAIPMLVEAMGDAEKGQDLWNRIGEKSLDIWDRYQADLVDVAETVEKEKFVPDVEPMWSKVADAAQDTLDRIGKLQESHLLQLQRQEEDAAKERARAWDKYEKQVAKAIKTGEKKLTKITTEYEEDRAEVLADYQEAIVETETDTLDERLKAQEDFEREMKQSNERFQLDQLQSQRRYEYERAHLVAEGDTLAIEQLDELYKLEQQEAAENEDLQQRQAQENFDAQIKDMEQAATDLLAELSSGLEEQLIEQEQAYREQLVQQQEANSERLAEMAADFADRQRLEDEDRAITEARQEEDYRRQLADLGENLSDQLREQEIHYGHVAVLLEQYYGEGGVADAVLAEYHARELERIGVTAEAMAMMTQIPTLPATAPPGASPVFGMQHGGIVTGPAHAFIEAGQREAFVPLGGSVHHSFNRLNVGVSGLESASPADVNAIASALAREMTHQVRTLRRS